MVVLTCVQEILIFCLINNGILKALPLVVVDEDVPHDGIQPPFDVRAFFKVVLVSQRFHKGFLHQIICVFTVTCEAHGETGKEILMRGQELVEFDR